MNEDKLHQAVARWLDRHPATRGAWLHVPLGGARTSRTGAQLKAMGAKPGFPDVLLCRAAHNGMPCAIELKTAKGKLSEAQKTWLHNLELLGWNTAVCRSVADVTKFVTEMYR